MMKVKTQTAKETKLVSEWLYRFGINHTIKGSTIEFGTIDLHHWNTIQSAVRLNTESNIDHIDRKSTRLNSSH